MADKKAFVFDTNFIIQNKALDKALDKIKEHFTVYISQVSIDERIAQQCRNLRADFDEAERCRAKFINFATITFNSTFEEERKFYETGIQIKYKEYFGTNIIPFQRDGETLTAVIDRANKRQPPFSAAKDASDKGFKDCLLWISILNYFKDNGEDEVVLVSDDGGFRNNAEFLQEEFNKITGKNIVIKPNAYYNELLESEKGDATEKKPKPLPDFSSLRDRIHKTIYDLCFVVTEDYWGNETEKPVFMISEKVNDFDVDLFFLVVKNLVNDHILEKTVLTKDAFSALDGVSPVMKSISIDCLEKALCLYDEIMGNYSEYVNQFYSAVVNMFNRNYVEPKYDVISDDDDLPF